ncbi:TRAP transporter permease [Mailhella massiliensis]|uniref:TRAP transporter permease n=1 Tax=Mailhella massiliensis TaxID=1903261 RepID=UPI0023F4D773|nr:TRAP transporter permease [Mailhella massiliensis]
MPQKHIPTAPAGDKYKEDVAHAEHGMRGDTMGITAKITFVIALCWSLFQMASASILLIDSIYVKSIHLAFAIILVYFNIPMIKPSASSRWDLRILLAMNRVTVMDYILGIMAAVAALYIFIDYAGLASRPGSPIARDILMGILLVVLLLEATRRVLGPALPIISTVFIIYVFTGPYLPDFLAFKGASLSRFISQITMDTQGVYGIPLQVSATVVFLFVLFGTMLDRAGGGTFFTQLAISGLGRYRGGAAKAAVFSSALSGMVSGSSIANVVTTGTFTIPLMKKVGYPAVKAAAIEVASSVNGQLAPPVMGAAAFIIAEYVNVPYIEVAKAAAIPAFASYAALLWITHVEACKLGLRGLSKDELPRARDVLRGGLHFLFPLAMLLYELIALQHSAELAVFRAIIVLAVIMIFQPVCIAVVRKTSKWEALKEGLRLTISSMAAGANNMAGVALATASAGIIVGCVSLGLGQQITSFVEVLSMGNIFLLLIITAAASLLLGMGLPTTANYIIMASLTAPVLVELASGFTIHGMQLAVPLMAAHLYCFYFGILADDTPPVGLAAYAGAAIANTSPIAVGIQGFFYDIRTALLPLVFIFNHDIILWNIHSLPEAVMIFCMTSLGMISFSSLIQGWFITKTSILDRLLLFAATVALMYPALITGFFLPHDQRYLGYILGLALMILTWLRQKAGAKFAAPREAAA